MPIELQLKRILFSAALKKGYYPYKSGESGRIITDIFRVILTGTRMGL